MRRAVALVLTGLMLSGCTGDGAGAPVPTASDSAVPTGPAASVAAAVSPGASTTSRAVYELDDLRIPGLRHPVEVQGRVVGPADARGPVPMVMFLHGYNGSCWRRRDGSSSSDWPCAKGYEPIPNADGFGYLQQRLASQGYLTVSLSANGVNVLASDMGDDAGSEARSALLRHHLDAWAAGVVPGADQWPQVDMGSVLLVGHSRGGEGVDRAAGERPADARWAVRGEVLVAPTAFEPPARGRVPMVAMTGYCDGDVGPGPGQRYVDRPADPDLLRSSIIVEGANHNFFNTEWSPQTATLPGGWDDALGEDGRPDPLCRPDAQGRLTADEQQDVALRIVGLAAAAFLRGDRASADVLDGRSPVPVADPSVVRVAAVGRGRSTLADRSGFTGRGTGSVTVRECDGVSETEDPGDCGAFTGEGVSVHWPAADRRAEVRRYVEVTWDAPGGAAELALDEPLDLRDSSGVEARIAVAPEGPPVEFDVVLTDTDGRSTTWPATDALSAFPDGPLLPSRRWGQRLFAPTAKGTLDVDLSRISTISLAPTSANGHVWIIDVSSLPADPPAA